MSKRISVLVPPGAAADASVLSSLDHHTLAPGEVEVLVADDGRSPELTRHLDDLVAHRVGWTRVPVDEGQDVVAVLLDRAAGEHVVVVPAGRVITPTALERLSAAADDAGADLAWGLTARAGERPARVHDPASRPVGPAGRLHRRLAGDPTTLTGLLAADLAGTALADDSGAAVSDAVCFVDHGPHTPDRQPAEPSQPGAVAEARSVTWTAGVVEIVVDVRPRSEDLRATVHDRATGVEWPVPDVQAEHAADRTTLTIRIDPDAVAGVGALADGTWWPSVRTGPGPEGALLLAIGARKARGGTFRSRPVVSFADDRRLGLDVGGHSRQPVRRLDPPRMTVVEDSRGSLLTAPVRNVDLPAGTPVRGQLRLGSMPVPATLEHDGDDVVLRAFVSGLAGSSDLAVRFTPASFASTGTRLVIDGAGAMSVARVRRPAAAADAPARSDARTGQDGPGRRAVRRLARAVRR